MDGAKDCACRTIRSRVENETLRQVLCERLVVSWMKAIVAGFDVHVETDVDVQVTMKTTQHYLTRDVIASKCRLEGTSPDVRLAHGYFLSHRISFDADPDDELEVRTMTSVEWAFRGSSQKKTIDSSIMNIQVLIPVRR